MDKRAFNMASRGSVQFYILVLYLCISYVYGAVLSSRANPAPACVGLSVKSNDGDRKIAIVIDASFSMLQNDPDDRAQINSFFVMNAN